MPDDVLDVEEEKLKQGQEVRSGAGAGLFRIGWSGRGFQTVTCGLNLVRKLVLWDIAGPLRAGLFKKQKAVARAGSIQNKQISLEKEEQRWRNQIP